jgi:hypothetical protein
MHFQNFGVLLATKIVRCFRNVLRERPKNRMKKFRASGARARVPRMVTCVPVSGP